MILGASFDSIEENRAFAEKYKFPFPLIADVKREVGMLYGACDTTEDEFAMRVAYLINAGGTIVEAHPKVNPSKYPEEQLATIST